MFRLMLVLSLCLLIAFTGIGLLISREWGWSEYASDELYVVAFNTSTDPASVVLVNANGSGQEWDLRPSNGTFEAIDCSPDGRTLAFVSDSAHLYVINHSGLLFERTVKQSHAGIQVSNTGAVVYLMELIVNANENHPLAAPEEREYASPAVSASGLSLWIRPPNDVVVTSEKHILMTLGMSGYPAWLGSEDIFAFSSPYPSFYGGHQYLADTATQTIAMLPSEIANGVFSPDGTKRAIGIFDDASRSPQVYLANIRSNDPIKQISHNKHGYRPLCFLTFRPQMLIDNTQ